MNRNRNTKTNSRISAAATAALAFTALAGALIQPARGEPTPTVRFHQMVFPTPHSPEFWTSHSGFWGRYVPHSSIPDETYWFQNTTDWQMFDDVTFPRGELLAEIRWQGAYLYNERNVAIPSGQNTDSWVIEIWSDGGSAGGESPGELLYQESLPADEVASEEVGHWAQSWGVPRQPIPRYEFRAKLASPFEFLVGVRYWISVRSVAVEFEPFFVLADGFPDGYSGVARGREAVITQAYLENATSYQGGFSRSTWEPRPVQGDADSETRQANRALTLLTVPVNDADADGMDDQWESDHKLDPAVDDSAGDPDGDGLSNLGEFERGTDPQDADSDDDGLVDLVETGTGFYAGPNDLGSFASVPDSDRDGLRDGLENPGRPVEPGGNAGTDPNLPDSDEDGLGDKAEWTGGTDPLTTDSDGDGISDRWERRFNTDPNDPADPITIAYNELTGSPKLTWRSPHYETPNEFAVSGQNEKDATFRLHVDFDPKPDGEREVILEIGGSTNGLSLTYEADNLLVLRAAGEGPDPDNPIERGYHPSLSIRHQLTEEQLAGGAIELIWGFDVLNANGTQSFALWVDGILCDEQEAEFGPSWTSRGDAAFAHDSLKGLTTSGIRTLSGKAFSSGEIDFDTGLQYFEGAYPETRVSFGPVTGSITIDRVLGEVVITWGSEVGAIYAVEASPDLSNWTEIARDITGTGEEMSHVGRFVSGTLPHSGFYRVRQQLPREAESVGGMGAAAMAVGVGVVKNECRMPVGAGCRRRGDNGQHWEQRISTTDPFYYRDF